MGTHRATLPQVADRAGVSLASASRALHGSGASKAMVEKVRVAAAELGYQADATGRSLRLRRTFQIAFAVADIGNPVYVEMMKALQGELAGRGYRLMVATTGDSAESTIELVHGLSSGLVDGLVVSPLRVTDALVTALREAPVPVVVIGRSLEDSGLNSVSTDSAGGIGQAVAHIVALGRRRIGFLNGPADTTPGSARRRGFDEAVEREGFSADLVDAETAGDFTVAAGRAGAQALLARHAGHRLDAIVAANDLLAIGAIKAVRETGLHVPEDVAVTGMDDTEIGQVYQPSLTSVSLHSSERGRRAAELMLALLDDPSSGPTNVFVAPELRVRESTCHEEEMA
ncbi:LacI family DNA-binding transcriptional regulator [Georgenia muralis]|uniref:LacI family transcriptional regulator n=1 Tax=Georgenia muralis TaxID=154117 RepID=A0A3N4ZAV2_9MICO|nr:LacI family DNA-binding transcriptional regulator [Georgenia muralis]RPF29066.1 LacI family transcriptional regulator [Georgenia muralis]